MAPLCFIGKTLRYIYRNSSACVTCIPVTLNHSLFIPYRIWKSLYQLVDCVWGWLTHRYPLKKYSCRSWTLSYMCFFLFPRLPLILNVFRSGPIFPFPLVRCSHQAFYPRVSLPLRDLFQSCCNLLVFVWTVKSDVWSHRFVSNKYLRLCFPSLPHETITAALLFALVPFNYSCTFTSALICVVGMFTLTLWSLDPPMFLGVSRIVNGLKYKPALVLAH